MKISERLRKQRSREKDRRNQGSIEAFLTPFYHVKISRGRRYDRPRYVFNSLRQWPRNANPFSLLEEDRRMDGVRVDAQMQKMASGG